ncbi:mitochondrial carrier domain-containing protein [Pyrenochaeta sp. MPI-SDFR-AT-0127]|nr:mitochondrial carrier domain-containing protein [Pyrenochaeta sp. MPI-SDFR-AT-0127]
MAALTLIYPTEYVKTRQQLLRSHANAQSPIRIFISTLKHEGIRSLYTGGVAFSISSASKSGIRFLTFDFARTYMPKDASGKPTVIGNLLAGVCAGTAESVLVLAPGENLKTRLIDDRAGAQAYSSSMHAIRTILRNEGILSFFRVAMQPSLGSSTSAVAGALAGIVTVCCTMPFDNIKTQLRTLQGSRPYKGPWDCATRWGTSPRLVRLSVSGAISFTIYEEMVRLIGSLKAMPAEILDDNMI